MMKKLLIALLAIIVSITFLSCNNDESGNLSPENEEDVYFYTKIENLNFFCAKVKAIKGEEVDLEFDLEANKKAIKDLDKDKDMSFLFKTYRIWISLNDWPVPIHVGDDLYFEIVGYGILKNYNSSASELPPCRLFVEPGVDIVTPIYSYTKVEVDTVVTAKVLGFFTNSYRKGEVSISINRDLNSDAIKKIKESVNHPQISIIFSADIEVIRAKDWPVPLKTGDIIKFKITGFGIQQNYRGIVFDLEPVIFYIDPIIEENS